jgi:hypothetical protein
MGREEMQYERSEPQADTRLEQALDRLGAVLVPKLPNETDFVSRVMARIVGRTVEVRPKRVGRWLVRMAIAAAACLAAIFVFWREMAGRSSPPSIVASNKQEEEVAPMRSPIEAARVLRTSTWSTVTEGVVLENDVPVRKLLYREFERVELLDSQGNTESHLIFPTKAMLVATDEQY